MVEVEDGYLEDLFTEQQLGLTELVFDQTFAGLIPVLNTNYVQAIFASENLTGLPKLVFDQSFPGLIPVLNPNYVQAIFAPETLPVTPHFDEEFLDESLLYEITPYDFFVLERDLNAFYEMESALESIDSEEDFE